jgi:hypothetical protein
MIKVFPRNRENAANLACLGAFGKTYVLGEYGFGNRRNMLKNQNND